MGGDNCHLPLNKLTKQQNLQFICYFLVNLSHRSRICMVFLLSLLSFSLSVFQVNWISC